MNKTISRILAIAFSVILVAALAGCAVAGDPTLAGADGTAEAGGFGTYGTIIYVVVIIAIFYFLMIRPERKRRKQAEELRSSVTVGDYVTTIGGIYGKVVHVNDKFVVLESGEDRVRIQIAKWGVSSVGKDAEEQPQQ